MASFTTHQKNIQSSANEIYKYLHDVSPTILGEVFKVNETILYDLRMRNELYAGKPKAVRYGTETIPFLSPKLWALTPQNKRFSLPCFKKWKPNCPCCLCKAFLQYIGFIWFTSSPPFSVFNLFEVHFTCSCSN